MKKILSLILTVSTLLTLAACGGAAAPATPTQPEPAEPEQGQVYMGWYELGEGPHGWVIGIDLQNETEEDFTGDIFVTITDSAGNLLGEDTVHMEVAANDYKVFPVHCEKGDTYNVDIRRIENVPEPEPETPSEQPAEPASDDRGIPGMDPYALTAVLAGDPFHIPRSSPKPAANTDYCATTQTAGGGGEGDGVMYDYSLSLDADNEIVGASLGITATTATERELELAADLYFYAVSLMKYDTCDEEALAEWFSSNLPNASDAAIETTIGDATYELHAIPGVTYWVDISKATA